MNTLALSMLVALLAGGPAASPPPSCTACACLKPPFAECSTCCYARVLLLAPLDELQKTLQLSGDEVSAVKRGRRGHGTPPLESLKLLLDDKSYQSLKEKLEGLSEGELKGLGVEGKLGRSTKGQ